MKKKLVYIISGVLICFIASIVLNQIALQIIDDQSTSLFYFFSIPILMLVLGVGILSKGIRYQVND